MIEPNYNTTKFARESLLAIEIKKTQVLKNKLLCFGLSLLELSKILIYKFWHDYVKSKYGGKAKLSYMDTNSFIVYIKTDNIYKGIVETRFDTSKYELDRPFPKGKMKK